MWLHACLQQQNLTTARARLAFARGEVGTAAELLAQLPERATRYVRSDLPRVSPGAAFCSAWQRGRFAKSLLRSLCPFRLSQLKKRHTHEATFTVLVDGKVRGSSFFRLFRVLLVLLPAMPFVAASAMTGRS